MSLSNISRRIFLGVALAAMTAAAGAQQFPSKPLKLVVPFPAGGTSDSVARMLAHGLSEKLKQTVVVENKAGAGTVIGADAVAKSAPDGYTLLLTSPGIAINAAMRKASLPYDTEADLEPVATLAELPMAIYAAPSSGWATLADVIAAAKAKPGAVGYGTAGEGSTGHLSMKLLEQVAGIKLTHVPFQGSAPSMNALLGGHVQLSVDTAYLGAPHVAANKIVGIATLGTARSRLMPNVPTAVEAGVRLQSAAWFGVSVRAGTPAPIVAQLNAAISAVVKEQKVRESLEKDGFQVIADTYPEAKARFKSELAKMSAAVRDSR